MKIALYIEDGLEQIILTPESDTEKGILGKLHDGSRELAIKSGSFYKTQGGYTRYAASYRNQWGDTTDDESTMIILQEKEEAAE